MYDGAQCTGSSLSPILPGHQMEYCRRWRFVSATARRPSPRNSAPVNFLQGKSRKKVWDNHWVIFKLANSSGIWHCVSATARRPSLRSSAPVKFLQAKKQIQGAGHIERGQQL